MKTPKVELFLCWTVTCSVTEQVHVLFSSAFCSTSDTQQLRAEAVSIPWQSNTRWYLQEFLKKAVSSFSAQLRTESRKGWIAEGFFENKRI